MKRLLLFAALSFAACGPDVTAWKGTWAGSGDVNTGRQPYGFTGTLTVSDGARFEVVTDAQGMPATSFSFALTAATATGDSATFTGPTQLQLTANPADGCTRQVTLDKGWVTRTGDSFVGQAQGKVKTDCTGGSSTAESWLVNLAGNRR